MRKTKFSVHSNVDTNIAGYDDHYLESFFLLPAAISDNCEMELFGACMLQPARTTIDGVSYMASCGHESRTATCFRVACTTDGARRPFCQRRPCSTVLRKFVALCTAHVLLETCCHMKAKLFILTIAFPGVREVLFHFELCNVLHTLAEHGIDYRSHALQSVVTITICLVIFNIRSVVVI